MKKKRRERKGASGRSRREKNTKKGEGVEK
jgi:hypothetical protein